MIGKVHQKDCGARGILARHEHNNYRNSAVQLKRASERRYIFRSVTSKFVNAWHFCDGLLARSSSLLQTEDQTNIDGCCRSRVMPPRLQFPLRPIAAIHVTPTPLMGLTHGAHGMYQHPWVVQLPIRHHVTCCLVISHHAVVRASNVRLL